MESPNRFSATLIIRLAFAIKNARFTIKRHLLAVLTGVIWLSFLICSLAAWPSVERTLLVKMAGAIIEPANDEKLPELIRIGQGNPAGKKKSEGMKKSSLQVKPKGWMDWRSFRAQPLEIEAL